MKFPNGTIINNIIINAIGLKELLRGKIDKRIKYPPKNTNPSNAISNPRVLEEEVFFNLELFNMNNFNFLLCLQFHKLSQNY